VLLLEELQAARTELHRLSNELVAERRLSDDARSTGAGAELRLSGEADALRTELRTALAELETPRPASGS
jgi:hypothetical protein